jgi:hypothetical protein
MAREYSILHFNGNPDHAAYIPDKSFKLVIVNLEIILVYLKKIIHKSLVY